MAGTERVRCGTPCGVVELHVGGGRVLAARLTGPGARVARGEAQTPSPQARRFVDALGRHFRGEPPALRAEELDLPACSAFRRRVYGELMKVGFGRVITYGELAARVGRPGGARAVGQALGRNPWAVFVPCHRVIAAGGRLGGFGAGPLWKARLLAHEGWTVADGKLKEADR